ncbi:hypothetical protein BDV09DRAFT_199657 [Aspergillus tetrazonus]
MVMVITSHSWHRPGERPNTLRHGRNSFLTLRDLDRARISLSSILDPVAYRRYHGQCLSEESPQASLVGKRIRYLCFSGGDGDDIYSPSLHFEPNRQLPHLKKGGYERHMAYAQSKKAAIYLANKIERRYGSKNLHATGLHARTILTKLFDSLSPKAANGEQQ